VEETAGSGWTAAVHPDDREPHWNKWRASLATGEPFEDEVRFCCAADGKYRWFLVRNVPLRDKHGRILRWHGILADIEDRKRAEQDREKLRQLETDLARINRVNMMGELATSIAHEVNQPLSGIVTNGSAGLRWLAGDPPSVEEVREALRDIVRDGKRAGEVIARIRALTVSTALPREKLDLNETIRQVLALVEDEAKRKSVVIRTQFSNEVFPVFGDRVQLQQVVINLVMNAIEAMSSANERARELVITTRNIDPDQVQVTVADTGKGLDPDTISRIFESFYTTKSGGMGMGLSISRSILENHGGRLWATANDGPGASFHFNVPKYHPGAPDAGVAGA
jgi:signal transduction histidine kinase